MAPGENGELCWSQDEGDTNALQIVIVGGGLGGLGAAIGALLAGHEVVVLEAATKIGEIGAGIQVLPNSARVLFSWGLHDVLEPYATTPKYCHFVGWRGNRLGAMNYHEYGRAARGVFWDLHRADLHRCLLNRVIDLGGHVMTSARATGLSVNEEDGDASTSTTTVTLADGRQITGDLVVGADGIKSNIDELLVGRTHPPTLTGDIAYRLLLDTRKPDIMDDPELRNMVEEPQVTYWVGPDKHAVTYVLRGGHQLNMVLLVPDDMPLPAAQGQDSTSSEDTLATGAGTADEMRALFDGWDPRISRLLATCDADSVLKWRLAIRPDSNPSRSWSHPSGSATLLGDAVHATLPYLASGAAMALEDGGVLGLCLARICDKSRASKRAALAVYEARRRQRTQNVPERGSHNQHVFHLHDGPEQRWDAQWFAEGKSARTDGPTLPKSAETGKDPLPWRYHGIGRWLLTYDMFDDVEVGFDRYHATATPAPTPRI
ncbi:FAD-binding domain-containing protein [Microdochium trichocladiopsis]|uniref:FAD-binding domain-containing protein n=1 Tax=Microdochium trichocladiopsis TaxID=1682393 RepID=A0A9P9BKK8_9PEZI|nr:FAD-binding domain-containing protein [Microdochium trichocladiopsis]KAH7020697.1 FAD-binding domain-containing protein [Microdochium trichocladiopsis]